MEIISQGAEPSAIRRHCGSYYARIKLRGKTIRRGIDPQEYLTDVLGRLPGMKTMELDSLLPENWQAARARAAPGRGPPSHT